MASRTLPPYCGSGWLIGPFSAHMVTDLHYPVSLERAQNSMLQARYRGSECPLAVLNGISLSSRVSTSRGPPMPSQKRAECRLIFDCCGERSSEDRHPWPSPSSASCRRDASCPRGATRTGPGVQTSSVVWQTSAGIGHLRPKTSSTHNSPRCEAGSIRICLNVSTARNGRSEASTAEPVVATQARGRFSRLPLSGLQPAEDLCREPGVPAKQSCTLVSCGRFGGTPFAKSSFSTG